ncbi:MAG: biotin/lipoyl-binding protein [Acidobacteria bacterium]|nr:biotin/lipoyl-binding protein [Acidobacteriota bacterium]
MELQIDIGGRTRTVIVETKDGQYHVTSDGETWLADAAVVDGATYSLILPGTGYTSHEVGVAAAGPHGDLSVHLASGITTVRRLSGAGRFGGRGVQAAQAVGTQQVVAPMPGKVVRVLVKPGDQVKARQGLVVVEAMKMENELRSPKDGRIVDVFITEGTSVEAGRLLVVVE